MLESGLCFLKNPPQFRALSQAEKPSDDIIAALRDWVITATSQQKAEKYLVSSEALCGGVEQAYKNAPMIAASLAQAFSDFSCEIVCYLRRQDTFAESLYTQFIHQGRVFSFDEFCAEFPIQDFNWLHLLDAYATAFGQGSMHPRLYGQNLLEDFCSLIGIASNSLDIPERAKKANRGYSRDVLEIARAANLYLNHSESQALRRILQEIDPKEPFAPYAFFPKAARGEYLKGMAQSNVSVVSKYFPENKDRELFSEPDEFECIDRECEMSTGKAISILASAVGKLAYKMELKGAGD